MIRRVRRWVQRSPLVAASLLAWLAAAAVPFLWIAYNQIMSTTAWERRDSEYGSLSWSLIPPGRVCRFNQFDGLPAETVGPSPWLGVYLILVVLSAAAVVIGLRQSAGSEPSAHR